MRQIEDHFNKKNQPYLKTLFKAIYSTMYFGLFRIGELSYSKHIVLARDVHIAYNKRKFMFILRTSKTHYKNSKKKMIKITSTSKKPDSQKQSINRELDTPCPYKLLREYLGIRSNYKHENEQFFFFLGQFTSFAYPCQNVSADNDNSSGIQTSSSLFGSCPTSRQGL